MFWPFTLFFHRPPSPFGSLVDMGPSAHILDVYFWTLAERIHEGQSIRITDSFPLHAKQLPHRWGHTEGYLLTLKALGHDMAQVHIPRGPNDPVWFHVAESFTHTKPCLRHTLRQLARICWLWQKHETRSPLTLLPTKNEILETEQAALNGLSTLLPSFFRPEATP